MSFDVAAKDASGRRPLPGQLVLPPRVGDVIEVRDPRSIAGRAQELAARQRSPETRRTYAGVYRSLVAFLGGPGAGADALTPEAVRAYRDHLEAADKAPATVAKHLSAIRLLADELGVDHAVRGVRSERVEQGEPRDLSDDELERILRMPDRRARAGIRDLAILQLMAGAGLRRSEVSRLKFTAIVERRRYRDPRVRAALGTSEPYAVKVRGKRGRERTVPLLPQVLQALIAWRDVRPAADTDLLFTTLPVVAGRIPGPLDARDVGRIAERHATTAGLDPEKRGAHVLRHTFATRLRRKDVAIDVIRDLLGHADIRTTQIYSRVNHEQLEDAIDELAVTDTTLGRLR